MISEIQRDDPLFDMRIPIQYVNGQHQEHKKLELRFRILKVFLYMFYKFFY